MSEVDIKDALKEAIKEWMDEKVLLFGRWSLGVIASAVVFSLAYLILTAYGFHK